MVSLTERDKELIARRAAGEYACAPQLRKISLKSRDPDDAVYLDFLRLVLQRSFNIEDYERLQLKVLEQHPHPFGLPPKKKTTKSVSKQSTKRVYKCRVCDGPGHNARGCPNKPEGPTTTDTDGFTRLSPGFDPSRQASQD